MCQSSAISRRRFLGLAVSSAVPIMAGGACLSLAEGIRSHGCQITEEEFETLSFDRGNLQRYENGDETIFVHSNNHEFDFALAKMLSNISDAFGVLPAFIYYDDSAGKNAYANGTKRMNRTDGTVAFGLGLLADKLARRPDGSHVAAVCAHEFGHIVQYKHSINLTENAPTVKLQELHADFLAGYFAAIHKESHPNYPAAEFALSQSDGGDPYTWEPSHHGTQEERGNAVVAGFNARKNSRLDLDAAIDRGISYVKSIGS